MPVDGGINLWARSARLPGLTKVDGCLAGRPGQADLPPSALRVRRRPSRVGGHAQSPATSACSALSIAIWGPTASLSTLVAGCVPAPAPAATRWRWPACSTLRSPATTLSSAAAPQPVTSLPPLRQLRAGSGALPRVQRAHRTCGCVRPTDVYAASDQRLLNVTMALLTGRCWRLQGVRRTTFDGDTTWPTPALVVLGTPAESGIRR